MCVCVCVRERERERVGCEYIVVIVVVVDRVSAPVMVCVVPFTPLQEGSLASNTEYSGAGSGALVRQCRARGVAWHGVTMCWEPTV